MSMESVAKFGWALFTAFVFLIVFCYLFRRFYSYCHFGVYDERETSREVRGNNNESRCDDHCNNIYTIDIGTRQEQFSWINTDVTSAGCVISSSHVTLPPAQPVASDEKYLEIPPPSYEECVFSVSSPHSQYFGENPKQSFGTSV